MMYPRLKLARNLLRDDGVILISIDDNEVVSLRKICDEIFGEENFVTSNIWEKADSPRNSARQFSEDHDYVIIYSKNPSWTPYRLERTEKANSIYSNQDNDPRGRWIAGDPFANKPYSKGLYTVAGPTGREFSPPPGRYWRISEEKLWELDDKGRIWWGPTGNARPSIKRYLSEVGKLVPRTLWRKEEVGSNRTSKNEMRKLFPDTPSFDTPKPVGLMVRGLNIATTQEDEALVLDFFAGSGTMGDAIYQLNVKDRAQRKFILVQLPELTETEEFKTIADIGKERIRRAAAKIKEEHPDYDGDLGFKVFKLDSSNILAWNPDRNDLEGTLYEHSEHLIPGRTEEDILYELLLKRGIDLTAPIEQKELVEKTVYSIGYGVLFACLDPEISRDAVEELANGIAAWHKEQDPASDTQVVFRDSAFADDVAKSNITAILQQNGIGHVRSL